MNKQLLFICDKFLYWHLLVATRFYENQWVFSQIQYSNCLEPQCNVPMTLKKALFWPKCVSAPLILTNSSFTWSKQLLPNNGKA